VVVLVSGARGGGGGRRRSSAHWWRAREGELVGWRGVGGGRLQSRRWCFVFVSRLDRWRDGDEDDSSPAEIWLV
jgi:hypothetical protein